MLTVRELMTREPVTVGPEESLRSAIEVLVAAGTGGAPVVSGGRLVGVVSLSDVLAFEADEPGVPTFRSDGGPLGDEEMGEAEAEEEAATWFRDMWEDVGSDLVTRLATPEGPEWDALDDHTVAEVMTRRVLYVTSDQPVREAARIMTDAAVHRLVVVDDGEVVGILSARHLVAAVARGVLAPVEPAPVGASATR